MNGTKNITRLALTVLFVIASLGAATGDLTIEQQERFDRLADGLIAPCCWRETARAHRSPAADEMRETLENRIRAGLSDDAIIDAFVAEHGERVLPVPRGRNALALFWTPIAVLVVGVVVAIGVIAALIRLKSKRSKIETADVVAVEVADDDLEW